MKPKSRTQIRGGIDSIRSYVVVGDELPFRLDAMNGNVPVIQSASINKEGAINQIQRLSGLSTDRIKELIREEPAPLDPSDRGVIG